MHEYKKHEPLIQRLSKQLEMSKAASVPMQQERQYIASAPSTAPQQTGVFFGQAAPQQNNKTNPPATPVTQAAPVTQEAPAARAVPVTQAAPVTQEAPAARVAPVTQAAPVTQEAPAARVAPVTQAAPVTQEAPAARVAPVTQAAPVTQEAPAARAVPVTQAAPVTQTAPVTQAAPIASQPARQAAPVNVQETMDPTDDLPSLFHHHYRKASGPLTNPARSIFVGVSSAFLIGVSSLFFSPQTPPSSSSPDALMAARGPIDIFAGDTGIISAKAYMEQSDRIQQAATIGLLPQQNGFNTPSIGSPISNIATGPLGVESTLSQLEKTLAPPPTTRTQPLAIVDDLRLALNSTNTQSGQRATPQETNENKMQQLTDQVVNALSGLNETNNNNTPELDQSVDQLRDSLSNLVSEAQAQGKDTKSVERLLKEALGKNQNKLPDALKGSDGRLDITTLIASVVKKSRGQNQDTSNGDDYLSQIENEGRKTALSSRQLETENGKRYLVVKSGDTLSSIAYTTYGDSFLYLKIFKANRTLLSNPNALRIGMRLLIPK